MEKVLLYNITDPARRACITLCLYRLGIEWIDIPSEAQGKPLGTLLGLPGYLPGTPSVPFSDEMVVFYNLSSNHLSSFLDYLRVNGVSIPLKAAITKYNIGWSSSHLHRELCAEHEALRPRGTKHK